NGWIFRHCCPESRLPHVVLSPQDVAASLRAMGYEILLARWISGPRFVMPLPPRLWGGRHDRLRRWLLLPVRLVNRLSLVAESHLKFTPHSAAFSMKCAVIARKPAR
ncbi:MAG TPA: hypothetical protein VM389_13405, partial [Phycisphaerae bacterium]|nr:hypothetical protein [Phycisphaerae bacterium]